VNFFVLLRNRETSRKYPEFFIAGDARQGKSLVNAIRDEDRFSSHLRASSFCSSSSATFLVSGTIVFTHKSCRHIIPAKNENT